MSLNADSYILVVHHDQGNILQSCPFSHNLSARKRINGVKEKSELGYSWESELKTRIAY